ncbi:MAG: hypothetical protein ACK5X3_10520 [Pseudomonadota bacterium]|jgi:hypothetical protein
MRIEKIYIGVEAIIQYEPGYRSEAKKLAEGMAMRFAGCEGTAKALARLTGKVRKRKPTTRKG